MSTPVSTILDAASVIPVLTVKDMAHAVPLAEALAEGGLRVIEMTLRTEIGLDALAAMKEAVPELYVGMGTIRTGEDVQRSVNAGADFLVSPGLTPEISAAMMDSGVASLPGVATASEAMQAQVAGFTAMKFFPAEQSGGAPWLKSIAGPLPDITFCPTGSITKTQAPTYLALPNVACVGGSWVVPGDALNAGDWAQITQNARDAMAMIAD
ncbi:bifunctional 4-hydroxy-2-oxoglutarate aldolase/2-dehydro-3-deoxy-phosphogluconate aldolase [Maricaulis sp. D1M11]|uniref:bifunctional 4-hydroxy-2-oxoglutarate aldolase/2-dehydro-3-deoxy-phosphogluconate aldolase n=1 Tax=Maricaulis sp. D1M11 TaxID=3076117 RepID=UPI0039B648DF